MDNSLIPLLLMIPVFYFLIIRPQSQERKKLQAMLDKLKKGDKVMTTGGLYAVVQTIQKESVLVKLGSSDRVEIAKSAVIKVVDKKDEDDKKEN
jgi:preprotein translocase subunit YajC